MVGVLIGFGVIAAIIATGYILGHINLLGAHAQPVLARLVYFVLSPCLLFTILADANVEQLFSPVLAVSLIVALVMFLIFMSVARLSFKRALPETVIGSLSASYVNAGNIGIPISVYVLGDPAASAPVMLLQTLVIAPAALAVLDMSTGNNRSLGRILTQPFRNPIIIGSGLGVLISVTGFEVPAAVMEPFVLIGAAAVPLMLMNYGIALKGKRVLEAGSARRDVMLASTLKLVLMPLMAWALGAFVFGLDGNDLFIVAVLAGLPTAQNIFNFAQRYGRGEVQSRDTILITTLGSLPVLVILALLLH